ncbi:N-acetylmuramoyl-L-alanine amidase [Salimicrobium humidisoli]|uniref:N-acetylmuramoyl-L-alanine amidase n=1 Tax=Salimicrobium humidisoli TaxID=2029857 RepID=A0ABX4HUS3_9BACI|nr:N-acetylmuramoyl-L-alanine amidase [Salimicrobium humidisoli]PBB06445.1 N-acetylmuramoyl-L-alanine amidase [Salimicrobium humidisoli]
MIKNFNKVVVFMVFAVLFTVVPLKEANAAVTGIPGSYKSEINYLIHKKVIAGYPDGRFRGDEEVSRQQAATMVGRALGLNNRKRTTEFPDVDKNSYASGYIQSAKDKGIITGYPDGTFRPQNTMTRKEMAYLVSKAFNFSNMSGAYFTDVKGPGSGYRAVNKVATAGVSNGTPDGRFLPNNKITRTEYSLFLARAMNNDYRVERDLAVQEERIISSSTPLNVRIGPGTGYKVINQFKTGRTVRVHKKVGNWLQVSYGNTLGFVHANYTTSDVSSSRVVAIDAGHGGWDPGASGHGVVEKEVNLKVSKLVRDKLAASGVKVVMPRRNDTYISLSGRVDYAQRNNADTFVSIHSNSFSSENASGVETYYSAAALGPRAYKSYKLSHFIQKRLVKAMDASDRGVKEAGFHVIKRTTLPSALVELGFVTNREEAQKLGSSYWRNRAANAVSRGIIDYYNWEERR